MRNTYFVVIGILVLAIFNLITSSAWAVPNLINYQGRLADPNGVALNGDFQMSFFLYTATTGGTSLWNETQTVIVNNGFYSVQLGEVSSFPNGLFDNDSLFLEVEIEGEILSPRQRITSTAYAIKAASADMAGDADTVDGQHATDFFGTTSDYGRSGIAEDLYEGTTTPIKLTDKYVEEGQLDSITSTMITDNAVTCNKIADGAVGTSNLADNAVTSEKIQDGAIHESHISFSLGPSDNYSLDAHDDDPKDVVYVDDDGKVGIGTMSPGSKAEIVADSMTAELCYSDFSSLPIPFSAYSGVKGTYGEDVYGYLGYRHFLITLDEDHYYGVYGNAMSSDSVRNVGVYGSASGGSENWAGYFIGDVYVSGNVGIGSSSPHEKLEINGLNSESGLRVAWGNDSPNLFGEFKHAGSGGLRINANAGGGWADMSLQTDGTTRLFIESGGNIGIGTTTPRTSLEISGTGVRMVDENPHSIYDYGEISFKDRGGGGLVLNSYTGGGWATISLQTNGCTRMFIDSSGNVGIGSSNPHEKLEINGLNSESGLRVAWGNDSPSVFGEFKHAGSGGLRINANAGGGWADMSLQTDGTTRLFIESGGNVGIGTTTPDRKLTVNGEASCRVLYITGGGDIAEPFDVKDRSQIKSGMVLVIDEKSPGLLTISKKEYDPCVAGIVSGAGGVNPGIMMSQEESVADGKYPVALTGRAYVWATTSNGNIKPGNLLTTSSIPGHAMKVTEHVRAQGAILGKAMSSLEDGEGLVLALVTLQ